MIINLSCPCGATFRAESGTFINGGGVPDYSGRVYLTEKLAAEFQQAHHECVLIWREEHQQEASIPVTE